VTVNITIKAFNFHYCLSIILKILFKDKLILKLKNKNLGLFNKQA
jgi:hypothetical protein